MNLPRLSPPAPLAVLVFTAALCALGLGGRARLGHSQEAAPAATSPAAVVRVEGEAAEVSDYSSEIAPLLARYCVDCHSGPEPTGDLVLRFADEAELRAQITHDEYFLDAVAFELSNGSMPPEMAERLPSDAERASIIRWAEYELAAANSAPDPGPYQLRRLNNREYANTIRDLLYLPDDWNAAADFPADERGEGFDTNSSTLILSPLLVEHWLDSAEQSVNKALNLDKPDLRRDATLPSDSIINEFGGSRRVDFASRQDFVRRVIRGMLPRVYRRPVTDAEIEEVMQFVHIAFTHEGESFDEATALVLRAALMQPDFLFRIERDPNPDGTAKVFEITEFQLASRLSYFLWATMPDEALFREARSGRLREGIDEQVRRMLQDPKAVSLTKDFLGQWLEMRELSETPNVSPELLAAMQGETEHFFNSIVHEDRSMMEFLDANYTLVNEVLAEHYGMEGVEGDTFQRVEVDPARRGGIFTHASFLTLTSKPLGDSRRTSPVNRGKWIVENIFSEKIPPPPPDVPALAIDTNQELMGTVRQILEQHRVDPNCAGCHARMDPYGIALENYDGFGAWREQDNGIDIDASGEIKGQAFATPREFRTLLESRREDFRRSLVRKLLSYALGRPIQTYDRRAVDAICEAVEAEDDRFSSVIINIVKSYPFQHARGSGEDTPPDAPPAPASLVEE